MWTPPEARPFLWSAFDNVWVSDVRNSELQHNWSLLLYWTYKVLYTEAKGKPHVTTSCQYTNISSNRSLSSLWCKLSCILMNLHKFQTSNRCLKAWHFCLWEHVCMSSRNLRASLMHSVSAGLRSRPHDAKHFQYTGYLLTGTLCAVPG